MADRYLGEVGVISNEELDQIFVGYTDARREHLIPILQEVQDRAGFLSQDAWRSDVLLMRLEWRPGIGAGSWRAPRQRRPSTRIQTVTVVAIYARPKPAATNVGCWRWRQIRSRVNPPSGAQAAEDA